MKRCLCLLALCLLLSGCGTPTATEPTVESLPTRLSAPGHPLEQTAPGALRIYPLHQPTRELLTIGDRLLLCSETGELTLLDKDLSIAATATLDCPEASICVHETMLSYFDSARNETVILSGSLREVGRIASPEGMVGTPILSGDCGTLFYTTPTAIRAWNLETGIRRTVKELSYDKQELRGLHQNDTVLQCRISDGSQTRTAFLSTETGQLVEEIPGDVTLQTRENRYYAAVPEGAVFLQLFGEVGSEPRLLTPQDIYSDCTYLPQKHQVIAITEGKELQSYSLSTGLHTASLTLLEGMRLLCAPVSTEQDVFLLLRDTDGTDVLCRWVLEAAKTDDSRTYIGQRYTENSPDTAALRRCQEEAARIGRSFGLEILVWDDPIAPWDYTFQPEYLAPVLERELDELETRLSYYPPEILAGIQEHFSGLTLCLVRQIQGAPASGSLEIATGVQYFQGSHAYIAIAVGQHAERALYHELYHVMETRLLTHSAALDRWESLNPPDFSYSLDGNVRQKADPAYFVDSYATCFPKEDRARMMECAMQSGNAHLFQTPSMQAKLACLCQAIREAYALPQTTLRWEQYLK